MSGKAPDGSGGKNDVFTTLPTKPTNDKTNGSLKHELPTSKKY